MKSKYILILEVYQEKSPDQYGMNLFASEELLEMTLSFDIRNL